MTRTTHPASLIALLLSLIAQALARDLTTFVNPPITSLGTLAPFNPPGDCFSLSVWRINPTTYIDETVTSLRTRYVTRWHVGCNIDDNSGETNTCCPPRFKTWGFYAPGGCPIGYTTISGASDGINPMVGEQSGTVCCPEIRTPELALVSAILINVNGRPPSLLCFLPSTWSVSSGTSVSEDYNGRAIVVFQSQLSATFEFPRITTLAPESTSSASPVSTSTSGPRETGSESNASSPGSSLPTSADPTSTADPNPNEGESSVKRLSKGAIAGITVGVSIPILLIVAFIAIWIHRSRKKVFEGAVYESTLPPNDDPPTGENNMGGIWDGSLPHAIKRNRAEYSHELGS